MTENEVEKEQKSSIKDKVTGLGQMILGEIEELAGVINADPLAQAEGEFNVEVGTIREGLDKDLAGLEVDK